MSEVTPSQKSRIYVVTPLSSEIKSRVSRLVRAKAPAGAVKFVTKDLFSVAPATTDQVAELVGAGTKVEDATVVETEEETQEVEVPA